MKRQFRRLADVQEQLKRDDGSHSSATNAAVMAPKRLELAMGNLRGVIFPADHIANGGDDVTVVVAKTEQQKEELDDIVV